MINFVRHIQNIERFSFNKNVYLKSHKNNQI